MRDKCHIAKQLLRFCLTAYVFLILANLSQIECIQCPENTWMCNNTIQCINASQRCDNIIHCEDGSDEGPSCS